MAGWDAVPAVAAGPFPMSVETAVHEDPVSSPVRMEAVAEPDPATRVRELANSAGLPAALREVEEATRRSPLSAELAFLRAVLLAELGRLAEAAAVARIALFLDRTLAVGHFLQGTILRRLGDLDGAARAFRNARDLAAGRPPDESVPLADGERAGRLAEGAAAQLAMVGAARRA